MSNELLTAAQVARRLNVKTVTIYAAAAAGRIPHIQLWRGRRRALIRFKPADIEELIQSRTQPVRD